MGFDGQKVLRVMARYADSISDTLNLPVPPQGKSMKFLSCICSREPADEKLVPLPVLCLVQGQWGGDG